MNILNIHENRNETADDFKEKHFSQNGGDLVFKQKDLPIHERKILENIQSSSHNYSSNLLEDLRIFKLEGKLEIIEILKELNMISDGSYNFIQKETKRMLNNIDSSHLTGVFQKNNLIR